MHLAGVHGEDITETQVGQQEVHEHEAPGCCR